MRDFNARRQACVAAELPLRRRTYCPANVSVGA
jgi:hypothetical protein